MNFNEEPDKFEDEEVDNIIFLFVILCIIFIVLGFIF